MRKATRSRRLTEVRTVLSSLAPAAHAADDTAKMLLELFAVLAVLIADLGQQAHQFLVLAGVAQVLIVGFEALRLFVQDRDDVVGEIVECEVRHLLPPKLANVDGGGMRRR